MACVVVFGREGASPYFRVGKVCADLLESEESAVDHCLQTLVATFGLCIEHMATAKCEQCEKYESYLPLSLTIGDVEGMRNVEVRPENCIHSSEADCTTPTDPASQIPCSSIPPPPKKRRVCRIHAIAHRTLQLIRLPPDFLSLFPKRKAGY